MNIIRSKAVNISIGLSKRCTYMETHSSSNVSIALVLDTNRNPQIRLDVAMLVILIIGPNLSRVKYEQYITEIIF